MGRSAARQSSLPAARPQEFFRKCAEGLDRNGKLSLDMQDVADFAQFLGTTKGAFEVTPQHAPAAPEHAPAATDLQRCAPVRAP